MNRTRTLGFLSIAMLLLGSVAQAASAEKSEDLSWDVETGTAVLVSNVNGDVRVRRSGDGKVHVKATIKAKGPEASDVSSALERVKIKAERAKGKLALSADIPANVKGGGLLSAIFGKDVTVTIHYDMKLPKGVALDADTVNGEVDALGLSSELAVKSVNGSISVAEHLGSVEAETVNGAITVEPSRALKAGRIVLSTVNGAIDLSLEHGSSASLAAETLNGTIRNDFDIPVDSRLVGSDMEGRVGEGDGGAEVKIESINGAIRINKTGGAARTPPREEQAPPPVDEGTVESSDLPR